VSASVWLTESVTESGGVSSVLLNLETKADTICFLVMKSAMVLGWSPYICGRAVKIEKGGL